MFYVMNPIHYFCRDLHWGNILVKTTKEKENSFILNDTVYSVETRGVHVNIIDYSLSRLEIGTFINTTFYIYRNQTQLPLIIFIVHFLSAFYDCLFT